jgi:hypothetical protein
MKGLRVVNHFAQLFPCLKERNAFGWDMHGVTRFRIASLARVTATDTETPKTTQLHLIP